MNKIGIVGNGYVGGAVAHGFSPTSTGNCEVKVHDVISERSLNTLDETVNDSDFVFVSVPTPMNKNGSMSLKFITQAFKDINGVNRRSDNVIILKSTVIPGTTEKLQEKFPELNIVFNPEFLTERSARLDFINQSRIILGGDKLHTSKVAELFNERFKYCHIIQTDYKTSEIIKYFSNVFFSVKVSFANEMKQVCDTIGADWKTALEGFVADGRIGDSHLNVPGPDGKMGFGGSCFPKDINAFMSFAKTIGVDVNTIKGAWETNLNVRPEKDWENLKGRAVTEE
jgi:nucleotide sugar dehydrogenase